MTDPADAIAEKKALRTAAKARRGEGFSRLGPQAGLALAAMGIGFAGVPAPAVVTGFLAIGEEIDPMPLISALIAKGYRAALPAMDGKGKPLLFRAWAPGDAMSEVQWGIREPLATAPTVEPDVLLCPLLAFDGRGFRLGYGGGFYDRSLARLRAMKPVVAIGLAFDEQRVDAVPVNDYDQPLDWVLTPSGPIRCSRV